MTKYEPDESNEWICNLDTDELIEFADKYALEVIDRLKAGKDISKDTFALFLEDYFQRVIYPNQGYVDEDALYEAWRDSQIGEETDGVK